MKALTVVTAAVLGMLVPAMAPAAPTIVVANVRSRPAIGTGVVYATIENRGDAPDTLLGATSPAARAVEMHESTESSMPMGSMDGMPMTGKVASMKRVFAIAVPARGERDLSTGGYHLMLVGLRRDLRAGDTIPLRLHFARAGWIAVSARVGSM